jgi:hypothetical protein
LHHHHYQQEGIRMTTTHPTPASLTNHAHEVRAVEYVASLAIGGPVWTDAMNVAFSRRGTRDAVLATVAQQHGDDPDAWAALGCSLALLDRIDNDAVAANVRSSQAAAAYVLGQGTLARSLVAVQPDDKFSALLAAVIDAGVPPTVWTAALRRTPVADCLAFPR